MINPGSASIVNFSILNATGMPISTSIRLKKSRVVVPEEFLPEPFLESNGWVIPTVVPLDVIVSVRLPNNMFTYGSKETFALSLKK